MYILYNSKNKKIYRITLDDGSYVDQTEDHTVFDENQNKLKPSEIQENTKLELSKHILEPNLELTKSTFTPQMIDIAAKALAFGKYDRVHIWALNLPKDKMKQYYSTFINNYKDDVGYSKTCLAGLKYLKHKI